MLRELHISNLAVIQDAKVEFACGLNGFTGQTGAGKSLLLGALELLLGLKSGNLVQMIRPGAEEARVSGVFELRGDWIAQEISRAADQEVCLGEELLVTRKVFVSGRSSWSINGQPATAAMLRRIAELLVDVHGQHDHQFLLKPSNQLVILDHFAQATADREAFAKRYASVRDMKQQQRELTASQTLDRQQRELYEFQADEIDQAQLQPGEYETLKQRHSRLSNVQRIQREAGAAYAALHESEGAVLERLQMIARVLLDMAELDSRLSETARGIRVSTLTLQDQAYDLNRYVESLDSDPAELGQVEQRLNLVNRLVSKYADTSPGDDPVQAVLAYRQQIQEKLDELGQRNRDVGRLDRQIAQQQKELQELGAKLTGIRQAAGKKMKPLIEEQMRQLGMTEAEFDLAFTTISPDADGLASPSGLDAVEIMVRTNPGQPLRPLRQIASGGELSRLMLAIKSILAQSDRISVLVFDEIDANIGGRLGTTIGRKLRQVAASGSQVLCITHLPQIAAFADRHFRIAKSVSGQGKHKETFTTVTVLQGAARIDELAEMLAGQQATPTTRKQVRELLAAASESDEQESLGT